MTRARHFCVRLCGVLAASLVAFSAVPAAAQVTVSILSTPANGSHYVAGEVIVTRISGLPSPGVVLTSGGAFPTSRMALQIGGATRQATPRVTVPTQLLPDRTRVDFVYTVTTSDFDADGISIPMNSISGSADWTHETGGAAINRDHAALPAQSAHQVVGHTASISATVPTVLTEGNLNGATATVTLAGVTFGSGVTTASFELVTTMTGVSISSVSSVSSGDASATLTLSSTTDISATGTLAVKVLGAAHSGSTDLTTAAVTVGPVLAAGPGAFTSVLSVPLEEGSTGIWDVALNANPDPMGSACALGHLRIGITSDNPAVTVSPAQLNFTTGNWNTPQRVTATAVRDDNLADETATISHAVIGDCTPDYPTGLSIGSVTVSVDDNTSVITVDSPSVVEGGDGDYPVMVFTVTLSPAASVQATVTYAVASGGTAMADNDFFLAPNTATLTFLPGETSKTIAPWLVGDDAQESDEGVQLFMSSPSPSRVVIAPGSTYPIGNIIDDDTPTLRIDSPRVLEGNTGTTEMEFTVTLLPAAAAEVTVDWSDAGEGTASAGDYQELDGGTLTFAAGETSKTIAVAVRGDATVEPDETVRVRIDNAAIATGTVHVRGADGILATESIGVGTIANDDGATGGPVVAQRPGTVILAAGEETEIDLSTAFADPDGSALTYSAGSNNPDVVSATVQGSVLRLLAGGRSGTTEVSVTATNRRGQTASVTMSVEVVGTETACSTEPAQAPEGGTATAVVELASAVARLTTVRWHIARDTDPATADADAGDHGGASGEVQIRAGERCAEIEIDILDDEDAEPAREWFLVVLRSSVGAQLARTTIPVAVMEGVCDRTPVVRSALLAATDTASCEAPASADLHRVSELTLAESGLGALAAEDFGDLTGLRTLDLTGNGLMELPALPALVRLERLLLPDNALEAVPLAALPAPQHLRELILSNNALSELPADAFSAAPGLRSLRLDGNRLNTLPAGLFAGSSSLRLLRLDGNPGAPFMVRVNLERTDAQPWASAPAMLRAAVPLGAPFEFAVGLTAEGATFADGGMASEATVAGGETAGHAVAVYSAGGFARVALTVPALPDRQCLSGPCWQGFALEAGPPLTLFARRVLGDEPVPLFGEDLRVSLSLLAEAGELSGDLEWSVYSSDPSLAGVQIAGGHLLVEPALGAEGDLRVEAMATDANGQTTTVYFDVRVEFHWPTRSWREIPIMDGQR